MSWQAYLAGDTDSSDVVPRPVGREGPHNRPVGWAAPPRGVRVVGGGSG